MKFLTILLAIMIVMVSCQDIEKMEKPEDLIPPEKMEDILLDLSLLQGARGYNRNMLEEKGIKPEQYLFEKYQIDSLQFAQSNNYYAEYYSQYQRIYDSVRSRLEVLKAKYDSLKIVEENILEEKRLLDSIEAAQVGDSIVPLEAKERILDSIESAQAKDSIFPLEKNDVPAPFQFMMDTLDIPVDSISKTDSID